MTSKRRPTEREDLSAMPQSTADLTGLWLARGEHDSPDDGLCLLEAVAFVAGKPHTDHPPCVSPVLGAFGRALNDVLPDDTRQQLVPLIPRLIGTAGDGQDEARSYLALDWLLRTYTPAWLDLAGLSAEAKSLRDLRQIVDLVAAQSAGPVVREVRAAAEAAARAAAWAAEAAGDAAFAAAKAAAEVAVRAAAWAAGAAAAWAAARAAAEAAGDAAFAAAKAAAEAAGDAAAAGAAAAWAAARAAAEAAAWAAGDALKPTVEQLQSSAIALYDAMITVVSS